MSERPYRRRTLLCTGAITAGGLLVPRVVSAAGTATAGDGRHPDELDDSARGSRSAAATARRWTQRAKLVPDDGAKGDNFSWSVAIVGTTAIVGSHEDENPNGRKAGAAYVFERAGGAWSQQAKLIAADGDGGDFFGQSVALTDDGSTALVGAVGDEAPNDVVGQGSVYVFERSGGTWSQQAKLTAHDDDGADSFGSAIAVAADTALVGAKTDAVPSTEANSAGTVHVYERSGGTWSQQAVLAANRTAGDGDGNDNFGAAVAMADDTAIVGAPGDEDPGAYGAGSAFVFERSGGDWNRQARFTADDPRFVDRFGRSVAVAGDTVLVGAPLDDEPNGTDSGAAYVFERSGGTWSQQAKLAAADGGKEDRFGSAVALTADTAFVGASHDRDSEGVTGAGYVFERSGGTWSRQRRLATDGLNDGEFGRSVAVADDTGLFGAPGHDEEDPDVTNVGAAFVFTPATGGGETTTGGTTPAGTPQTPGSGDSPPEGTGAPSDQRSTTGESPGPGILGTLTSLFGAGYLLRERRDRAEERRNVDEHDDDRRERRVGQRRERRGPRGGGG